MSLDLSSPDTYVRGFPHEVFRELRAQDPVSLQRDGRGKPFWAITRYHDVVHVLRTPTLFSSWQGGVLLDDPPPDFLAKLRENMLNRDPPDHTRMRRLVNRVFTPRRIEELEPRIASHAKALVESVRAAGGCDFATDIAGEMPLFVICEILGVPVEDRLVLYALTARMFGNAMADPEDARRDVMAAAGELRAYGAALAARKRAAATDDLLSHLVTAELDGQRLTDGEVEAFFMLLFNAGADTTRSLLCFGLEMLLEHPAALAALRADPAKLPIAIEEMLRFESPVIQFRRTARYDNQLGGKTIAEGDRVVVFFPSANRDEAIFERPDEPDLERWPNPHLAFGYGTHFCIGAPLARLEALHVFHAVLSTLDDIALRTPPVRSRSNFIRSFHSFEISFRGGS
jgi:cytochrome P450